jgi:hypothetical protein
MDRQSVFCPHLACPARGQTGQGNITIHSQVEARYRCTVCPRTFSARRGTPFYRTQYDESLITCVVTLVAPGCPESAAAVAFDLHTHALLPRGCKPRGTMPNGGSSSWSNSPVTSARSKPTRSASKRKGRWGRWPWRSRCQRACGSAA